MPRIQLNSIHLGEMQPLAYQGADVFTNYRQIVQLLGRKLGPRHAGLFAQPIVDRDHDVVDWFVQSDESVQPLPQAPPEQAEAARAELGKLTGEIRQYAEELRRSGESHGITIGKMLELALSYPGEEHVYLVGDQPVLAAWGMTSAEQRQTGVISRTWVGSVEDGPITPISRTGTVAAGPAASAAGEGASGSGPAAAAPFFRRPLWGLPLWLWAALAALLLALLLLFGLGWPSTPGGWRPGCDGGGHGDMGSPRGGPAGDGLPTVQDELRKQLLAREQALQEELRRLQDEWRRRQAECVPDTAPELLYPQAAPSEPGPEPEPAPQTQPQPQAKQAEPEKPKPGDELVVPKQAQEENDLGFLRGKWSTVTDLQEKHTGKPVVIEYEFDENGNGRSTVVREDGTRCSTPMRANFDENGDLIIEELSDIHCGRVTFYRSKVKCKVGGDGRASCQGYQEGPDNTYGAVIKRKSD